MRRFSQFTDDTAGKIRRSMVIAVVCLSVTFGAVSASDEEEDVTGSIDGSGDNDIVYDGVPGFYPGVIQVENGANRVYDGIPGFYPGTIVN